MILLRIPLALIAALLLFASPASAQRLEDWKWLPSDGDPGAQFGWSVDVDGDVAIVGAIVQDDLGLIAGAAYVYRFNPATGEWDEEDKLVPNGVQWIDFGWDVGISGDVAVVSDSLGSGQVWVFRYNSGTGEWDNDQALIGPGQSSGDFYGHSVAVSGGVIAVGSRFEDAGASNNGAVYVFRYNSGTDDWDFEQKLTGNNPMATDQMGYSVDVQGNAIITGTPGRDQAASNAGNAFIFRYDSGPGTWSQEDRLTASDFGANDEFGRSVAISGDVAIVGAELNDVGGNGAGSAYVFRDNGSGNWSEETHLNASDATGGDFFGHSVDISSSIEIAVIGAYEESENGFDAGSAYVFDFVGGSGEWEEQEKILASDGFAADEFAGALAMDGEVVVLGARRNADLGADSGSAYVINDIDFRLDANPDPLIVNQNGTFTITGGLGNTDTQMYFSLAGLGTTYEAMYNVNLDLHNAKDKSIPVLNTGPMGNAQLVRNIPNKVRNRDVWLQACQLGRKTNYVATRGQ